MPNQLGTLAGLDRNLDRNRIPIPGMAHLSLRL